MTQFSVKQIVNSVYNSNSYILTHQTSEGMEVWIIDVGDADKIMKELPPDAIIRDVFLTQTHYDHIYDLNDLFSYHPETQLFTNEAGRRALLSPMLNYSRYHLEAPDFIFTSPDNVSVIDDGMSICLFDEVNLKVIATPEHDASCLTFMVGDYIFSGDSFIPNVCTRATFRLSDKEAVLDSEQRIIELANNRTLCPGYGSIFEEYNNKQIYI